MKTEPNASIAGNTSIKEAVGNPRYFKELQRHEVNGGLTKREHFAGLAMQGLLASIDPDSPDWCPKKQVVDYMVEQSVYMADALIAELNKQQP